MVSVDVLLPAKFVQCDGNIPYWISVVLFSLVEYISPSGLKKKNYMHSRKILYAFSKNTLKSPNIWHLLWVGMTVCQGRRWQKFFSIFKVKGSRSLILLSFTFYIFAFLFCTLEYFFPILLCKLLHLFVGYKIRDRQYEIHSVLVLPRYREIVDITRTYTRKGLIFCL